MSTSIIWNSIGILFNSFLFAKNTIDYNPFCWLNLFCILLMFFAFYLEGRLNKQKEELKQLIKELQNVVH